MSYLNYFQARKDIFVSFNVCHELATQFLSIYQFEQTVDYKH